MVYQLAWKHHLAIHCETIDIIISYSNISYNKVKIEITIGEHDNKEEINCTKCCPFKINNTSKHVKNCDKSTNMSAHDKSCSLGCDSTRKRKLYYADATAAVRVQTT